LKKNITCQPSGKPRKKAAVGKKASLKTTVAKKASSKPAAIGMDLGDKSSRYCVLNGEGEIVKEDGVLTTKKAMLQLFSNMARCRIAIEVGSHSPWVNRLLSSLGFEVTVANSRCIPLISASTQKSDRQDAQMLARLVRMDPKLLRPIRHRGEQAQIDLMRIKVRAALMDARTSLVNTLRGLTKSTGERLPACDADYMGEKQAEGLPLELQGVLKPLLQEVENLTAKIKECDGELKQIGEEKYPETGLLRQVKGVGPLIAMTYVLTVEDPERFHKSRDVGCYVGLRPKRSESGERQPQLGITKEGDIYLRKMLVQGAQYILGHQGPDTDLRRWGLKLAQRGGKNAKKRAIVAVARKLGVLLHRLWVSGEVYEPLRNSDARQAAAQKAAA
jgi:transposase